MAALEASGQAENALVVVTSDHGEEFGEHRQVLHGGNLHRVLLEVPLLIRLPASSRRMLALEPGDRPANLRLTATLVEAAGGSPPPDWAPSLFEDSREPVLSELYLGNGVNTFSLLDGERQVIWESSFSPPEEDYYRARLTQLGGEVSPPLEGEPQVLFDRQERRYTHSLPLSGAGPEPRLSLWRWTPRTGEAEILEDQGVDTAARQLRRTWIARNGPETLPRASSEAPALTPEDEAEMRSLGYVQ